MNKITWERKLELCYELNAPPPEVTDAVTEVVRLRRILGEWRDREQRIIDSPTSWEGTRKLSRHTINSLNAVLGDTR